MDGEEERIPFKTAGLKRLRKAALLRLALSIMFLGLVFFLPAGTLTYWQAWVYLAIMFIPVSCVMVYLLKKNPELLERRGAAASNCRGCAAGRVYRLIYPARWVTSQPPRFTLTSISLKPPAGRGLEGL